MSILRDVVGAVCCCLPGETDSDKAGLSRDLKRLSDWRAHPTLREYELDKHIADGGFSEIWLVCSRSTGEEQCLKVVNFRKPGLLPGDVDILRGEARFLRLLEHPGLLRCRDVFETKYHMVMFLDYLSGGQMLDHLHKVEHYSEAQAARLFAQVAGAVAYMHNLNIVHRDIKPENIMFVRPVEECEAQGRPLRIKLIDLGMATVLLPPQTPEEAAAPARARKQRRRHGGLPTMAGLPKPRREPPRGCMGSPGFIAPEIVHGAVHTLAMDVYALGVLLFAMLTGRKPWSLRDSRNLSYAECPITEAPGLKDSIYLSLSSAARELLLAMLADDPRDRPTCMEVLRHPFVTQHLSRSGSELGQPALDDVIKRRIAQLASLRRFRGLAFAMIASRQEGQDLADFTKQLTERRKTLHRDLLLRAKTRRSLDLQRKKLQQEAEHQLNLTSNGSVHKQGARKLNPSLPPLPRAAQTPAKRTLVAPSGNSPTSPSDGRRSDDSACSQQPLLQRLQQQHQQQHKQQQQPAQDHRQSFTLSGDGFPHQKHHTTSQLDVSCRSLGSSLPSSDSSRQPLVGGGGGTGIAPLPSHHPSHAVWFGASSSTAAVQVANCAADAISAGVHRRGSAPQQFYLHLNNSTQIQRHALDPVAEPGEGPSGAESGALAAPTRAGAAAISLTRPPLLPPPQQQQQQPVAGTSGTGRNRGWSISKREQFTAARSGTKRPLPRPIGTRSWRLPKDTELELAVVDPLAIIRELSGRSLGPLGRAHSAPESLAATLLPLRSSAGSLVNHNDAAGPRRAGGSGGNGTEALLEQVAMGADMRALSANSWTLDLLENADLLAALTGVPLTHRISSSSIDTTVHGGTAMRVGSLAAVVSAASRASVDAAATAAVLQQLRSDTSHGGALPMSTSREASVHQAALAVLSVARVGNSIHGGSAAGAILNGRQSRGSWQNMTVFTTAVAAATAAADTPTRSVATGAGDHAATAEQPMESSLPPVTAATHGDAALLPSSGLGTKRTSQSRALFNSCPSPAVRPSLNGLSEGPQSQMREGAHAVDTGDEPLPLLRAQRRGTGAGCQDGTPSCDVPYTSLYLSAASRKLGVALPAAAAFPAAAAADATIAAASAAAAAMTAAAGTPSVWPICRKPSLALVDIDDQIAAQKASLEESYHNGKLWSRMDSGAGGLIDSFVATLTATPGAIGALGSHDRSCQSDAAIGSAVHIQSHSPSSGASLNTPGGLSAKADCGYGLALQHELRAMSQAASRNTSAAAMQLQPFLARITECSDLTEPPAAEVIIGNANDDDANVSGSEAEAAASIRFPNSAQQQPLTELPPCRQPLPAFVPVTSCFDTAAHPGKVAVSAPQTPGGPGRGKSAPGSQWRSPFEALAVESIDR